MSAAIYGSKRPQSGSRARPQSGLLHDKEKFSKIKWDQSAEYFRQTRISTCSHIKQDIHGRAIAVQFPLEKTGWKNPASYQNMNKLTHNESLNTKQYRPRPMLHAGMTRKPLEPYNPNSYRSRLPVATIVMPYKNSSQVVIGDRTSQNKNHFKTSNQLFQHVNNKNMIKPQKG